MTGGGQLLTAESAVSLLRAAVAAHDALCENDNADPALVQKARLTIVGHAHQAVAELTEERLQLHRWGEKGQTGPPAVRRWVGRWEPSQ